MTKIFTFIYILILCGCNEPSYIISKDGIKSNKSFQDGFDLIENAKLKKKDTTRN